MTVARPHIDTLAATVSKALTQHHAVGYSPEWGERCPICVEANPQAALSELAAQARQHPEMLDESAKRTIEAQARHVRALAVRVEELEGALRWIMDTPHYGDDDTASLVAVCDKARAVLPVGPDTETQSA